MVPLETDQGEGARRDAPRRAPTDGRVGRSRRFVGGRAQGGRTGHAPRARLGGRDHGDHEQKPHKIVAENRRARHDYFIEDDLEAGIMLDGIRGEVACAPARPTSPRATPSVEGGELWLINGYIPAYGQAKTFGHDERRRRKLLVSRRELAKLWQGTAREGMTLVPLRLYFNERGMAKLQIGIAKGKKLPDKRATEAKRDWQRQKARVMRERG